MSSKYAIALYELVCLRANREHCVETMSYDQFRDLLGVPPGTYDRGSISEGRWWTLPFSM